MNKFFVPALAGGMLALGFGTVAVTPPASADTVIVKRVKGVCYDRSGDRVSCDRTYRSDRDRDRNRYFRAPGVSIDLGTRERRRNRDRDWD